VYKNGLILKTDADFDNAIFFGLNINVWQDNEILDYGGIIESYSKDAVRINGAYYLKATCEFKVR
jgi:hypothetical protein